ncbi:hypothetical protein AK812_SmicGene17663 [Symbiodinium microadriaticum]|uniref:Uncharacterized protein n=1 Tax=Symbiodinium microadriaticum TaxID=2951 RepID=A0A1Q9DX51_SYMMI|nr:hypothetical protein AK812_SmicGene17663 [Symbiodinium microadriaticum]
MAKWRLPKAAEELHDDICACECRQGAFLHSKLLSTPLAGVFWTDPYSVCHGVDKQCLPSPTSPGRLVVKATDIRRWLDDA